MIRYARRALPLVAFSCLAAAAEQPGAPANDLAATLRLPGSLQARVRFDHITSANGLSHDSVFSILQDRHGFLWFGTQGGLNRFDGYQITQYRHDPQNPNSIAGDFVQVVFEDSRGGIWCGRSTLSRFDPVAQKFVRFDLPELGRAIIFGISEDRDGFIWLAVSTGRTLYRLDPKTGKINGHDIGGTLPQGLDSGINGFHRDPHGTLWLGSVNGLVRFDPVNGTVTRFPHEQTNLKLSDRIRALAEDRAGNLWLAATEGNANVFDPVAGKFFRRWAAPDRIRLGADINNAILAGDEGVMWQGTLNGLQVFDPASGAYALLRHNAADRYSLSADEVWSMAVDRQGSLWVGTKNGGVNRFSPGSMRFGAWRRDPANPRSLSDDSVRAIFRDRFGMLWIGTYEGGLNRMDLATGEFTHFRHDARNPRSLDDDHVYSIYEDRAGDLWIGTGLGISRLERGSGAFTRFLRGEVGSHGTAIPTYSLMEDRGGRFWFGAGEFKAMLDRRSGSVTSLSEDGGLSLHQDRAGNLWFGAISGLRKMDESGNVRRVVLARTPGSNTPAPVQINFVHEDTEGLLWLATETGLIRFDPKSEAHTSYTTIDGLPDNVVQCILPDQAGNLWLSTNNGISRFNPREKSFSNYHESDGLQGEAFNRKSCFVDATGVMYFGGLHGFNMFDPRRIPAAPGETSRVILTNFLIHGSPVPVRPGTVLPQPIWQMSELNLPPEDDGISFEFAALKFSDQARTRYRFTLEGLENQWTEVDSRNRSARYTGLRPRQYRFRVQASNDGRNWSSGEASIAIRVAAPWWMTWWAETLAAVLVVALLLGAYSLRVSSLHRSQDRLAALVDRRTAELVEARDQAQEANLAKGAFLANMSHELRTPLNAILGFSTLLRGQGASPQQNQQIEIIKRSGEHLLNLIDDVLDMAKIEAGKQELKIAACDLISLVRDVTAMMEVRASHKNVALISSRTPEFPRSVQADAAKLRQVLINLLGNAIKFTDQGTVQMRLSAAPAEAAGWVRLQIEVEDTGIGISAEDQARVFEPFVQAGKPTGQKGTGLGLTITRQFVEMMGGTISVKSMAGQGSVFTLEVPVEVAQDSETATLETGSEQRFSLEAGQAECRVLVVEDDPANASLLQQLLMGAGFQVQTAANGLLGVEAFQQWHPHFIWMDLRMPQLDGPDAVRRMRGMEGGREVKIAAMTASVFSSQREQIMAAGMDDFIRKPYRAAEIFECMGRHLGVRYRPMEAVGSGAGGRSGVIRPEALAALPRELRQELANAVISLNRERIMSAIDAVAERDLDLGAALRQLGNQFAYTALFDAIERAERESGDTLRTG